MLLTGNGLPPIVQEERPEDFVGLEIPDRRVVQDATQPLESSGPWLPLLLKYTVDKYDT